MGDLTLITFGTVYTIFGNLPFNIQNGVSQFLQCLFVVTDNLKKLFVPSVFINPHFFLLNEVKVLLLQLGPLKRCSC